MYSEKKIGNFIFTRKAKGWKNREIAESLVKKGFQTRTGKDFNLQKVNDFIFRHKEWKIEAIEKRPYKKQEMVTLEVPQMVPSQMIALIGNPHDVVASLRQYTGV